MSKNIPALTVCKNCGATPNEHTWVTRKCPNGYTYENYETKENNSPLTKNEFAARESGSGEGE